MQTYHLRGDRSFFIHSNYKIIQKCIVMSFVEKLLNHGLSATELRVRLLEILAQEFNGLTAEEIYLQVNLDQSSYCLATIYRVLSDLEKKGLLKKIIFARKKAIYKLLEMNCDLNIMQIEAGELVACQNLEMYKELENIISRHKNEYSNIEVILYKK